MSSLVSNVEDSIIAYGTTRLLRVRQIGDVYHIENLQRRNDADRWLTVVRSDGHYARAEIFQALANANIALARQMKEAARDRRIHEASGGNSPR